MHGSFRWVDIDRDGQESPAGIFRDFAGKTGGAGPHRVSPRTAACGGPARPAKAMPVLTPGCSILNCAWLLDALSVPLQQRISLPFPADATWPRASSFCRRTWMVDMSNTDAFSLPHSLFNDFLFAPIGEEGNGMSLSVLSALARLGIDPWQEAARLSQSPKALAAATLDGLIGRLPPGRWEPSDTRKIAARLVELLPRGASATPSGRARSGGREKPNLLSLAWLIAFALAAAVLFGSAMHRDLPQGNDRASAPASSTLSAPTAQQYSAGMSAAPD